jgi:hypothetical protein
MDRDSDGGVCIHHGEERRVEEYNGWVGRDGVSFGMVVDVVGVDRRTALCVCLHISVCLRLSLYLDLYLCLCTCVRACARANVD